MDELIDVLKSIVKTADDAVIVETLKFGKNLKVYAHDKHRWYTLYKRVVKIGDIFVEFQDYEYNSEESPFDGKQEIDMVINSMKQVFPKETTIIDYV